MWRLLAPRNSVSNAVSGLFRRRANMNLPNDHEGDSELDRDSGRELAESGALCSTCGGLCIATIEIGIIALSTRNQTGVGIPFCECDDCATCQPLNETIARLVQ